MTFSDGNEALWAQQTPGDNMTLAAAAERFGCGLGAEFGETPAGWRTRFDVATAPGNRYFAYVRSRGAAAGGRVYLGVGASAAGTWSAVFAPNTNSVILQNNTGYGFADVQSAPATIAANTWYALALDWHSNGDMIVTLYNEDLSSVVAQTAPAATGLTSIGGLAIRGLHAGADRNDLDQISRAFVEGFNHGNESVWAQQTAGDNLSLTGDAAHAGALGAEFGGGESGFRTRFDIRTEPGHEYYAYVRSRGAAGGRVYLGVGASGAGTWSAVFAPNSNTVIVQNNSGYGFAEVQSAPFAYTPDTWYVLALEWRAGGDMIARIYDEARTTVLAHTPIAASGFTTPGGIAIRGFPDTAAGNDIDTISVTAGVEDFEHGNEGLYAQQTPGDNMNVSIGSAHTGGFGAEFVEAPAGAGWRTRFDLATGPGRQYRAYVRAWGAATAAGRTYLGVGATPAGAWSAVFAPNSSEILLQDNTGYGFVNAASAPFSPVMFDWYILALDWRRNGRMRVSIYDGTGINLLAQTPFAPTGLTSAGGLALRGFVTAAGNFQDIDDITFHDEPPPCYADCNNDGLLTVSDFGCFQTKFVAGDCYADCTGEGSLTVADFGCFQTSFVGGCP